MSNPIQKNYQRTPSEVFAEIRKDGGAISKLKEHASYGLATVLQLAFDPKIILDLPEGEPPFTKLDVPPDLAYRRFDNAIRNIGVCTKQSNIPTWKKEKVFIEILQSISEADAAIVVAAKDKKLTELYPEITLEVVKAAIPGLLK